MKEEQNSSLLKTIFTAIFTLVCVGACLWFSWEIASDVKDDPKISPAQMKYRVEVLELKQVCEPAKITEMGKVMPVQIIQLKPKISGILVGFGKRYGSGYNVEEGEELLFIDDVDQKAAYDLALANLEKAKAAYDLELGSQEVAKREWEIMKKENPDIVKTAFDEGSLALRKPHLKSAQAELLKCESQLKSAADNLKHTVVRAPFQGLIEKNAAGIGMIVSPSTAFCDFYDTRYFWVDTTVTYETLSWLEIPNWNIEKPLGSPAKVYITSGTNKGNLTVGVRDAFVHRMRGVMNEQKLVRLMVKVDDPLALKESKGLPPLLLDSVVRVEIQGKMIENAYKIPRTALHDDKDIFIADSENKLRILSPKIIWKDKLEVYISTENMPADTRLILTRIDAPLEGVSLDIIKKS